MNRRYLQFNALRAFEAAARHASVSGAARELAVTHSAVSHQLKQLELQLGSKLFERTNRGLKITAAGELLAPVLSDWYANAGVSRIHLQPTAWVSQSVISNSSIKIFIRATWLSPVINRSNMNFLITWFTGAHSK